MNNNVIYMHTNTISNKSYIGLTTRGMGTRWAEHLCDAYHKDSEGRYTSQVKFHRAIRKYGIEPWNHCILYSGSDSNMTLQELEVYYIEKYNTYKNGYNSTLGGDGVDSVSSRKAHIANRDDSVKGYSYHVGVGKYVVQFSVLGALCSFGYFSLEQDAKLRADYLMSLSDEELLKAHRKYKADKQSKVKGYTYNKRDARWRVRLTVDGKSRQFSYSTEQQAINRVKEIRGDIV